MKNTKILLGAAESHEKTGGHPLLLSEGTQARLGFVKDMQAGTVWLSGHKDYIQVYRAKGSDLKVMCVSHFPSVIEHHMRGTYIDGPPQGESSYLDQAKPKVVRGRLSEVASTSVSRSVAQQTPRAHPPKIA